eukprot:222408-Pelagomonas_calceolata.AAC.1
MAETGNLWQWVRQGGAKHGQDWEYMTVQGLFLDWGPASERRLGKFKTAAWQHSREAKKPYKKNHTWRAKFALGRAVLCGREARETIKKRSGGARKTEKNILGVQNLHLGGPCFAVEKQGKPR